MIIQVSLNVLFNSIESLHISMSLATNIWYISLICSNTELFLIFILVLKYKLVGVIDGIFHIDDPGRLLQTIYIRKFKFKL